MKQYKLLLCSLFSMVLISSCITVSRIDKKDSRNNQFSQQLQNFMAVKHPQKIDTTFKQIRSDTTWGPLILDTLKLGDSMLWKPATNPYRHINAVEYSVDTFSIINPISTYKPKIYHQYVYIHDTVRLSLINHSEIDALISYLKVSRDSTSIFQLRYSQSKSAGLIKLFIAIGLGLLLIGGIILYIQKK